MSIFVEMKMGKYKQYSVPQDFNIYEVKDTDGNTNMYEIGVPNQFKTISEIKYSK